MAKSGWCERCSHNPLSALKDCPECALHRRGPNRDVIRASKEVLEKKFERTWFCSNNILSAEKHFQVRLSWLAILYECGWTEQEWEDQEIYISPEYKKNARMPE